MFLKSLTGSPINFLISVVAVALKWVKGIPFLVPRVKPLFHSTMVSIRLDGQMARASIKLVRTNYRFPKINYLQGEEISKYREDSLLPQCVSDMEG